MILRRWFLWLFDHISGPRPFVIMALVAACSRDGPARKEGSSTAVQPSASQGPVPRSSPASIRGDTFVLVAIGSQSTRVPVSDSAPCGFLPYLRLVISDERSFYHVTDNRPTCFGPPTDSASHWSGLWSTYRVNGDTLHLFQGPEASVTPCGVRDESLGARLPEALVARFQEGLVTPFLTALPDKTLP